MARLLRVVVPDVPLHVIQRGTNRCRIFHDPADYRFFLGCLQEGCAEHACDVHAYVLMTNHVHLLLSPRVEVGPSRLMQFVGGRYAQYFNRRYERVGALWQGRYKGTNVETDSYFLVCSRYVELNPVRAGMVVQPGDYEWSSYAHNALGQPDPLVRRHPLVEALGPTEYVALFEDQLEPETLAAIRDATNKGWALGKEGFRRYLEKRTGRRVTPRKATLRHVDGVRPHLQGGVDGV